MKLKRVCLSWFLAFCLLSCIPFSSWASTASSSNADREELENDFNYSSVATSSNAILNDFMSNNWGDALVSAPVPYSSLASITNTIDYSGLHACLMYYDMSGNVCTLYIPVNSDGWFTLNRPNDYASFYNFGFILGSASVPIAGKYRMQFDFSSAVGVNWPNVWNMWLGKPGKNISWEATAQDIYMSQLSGDMYFDKNIEISNGITIHVNCSGMTNFTFPLGGYIKVNFEKLSSSVTTDVSSPGTGTVNQDTQQDISNNTGTMVEQQETIIEQIVNVTETISSQLTAFWNQLAGEFTNLYSKMNTHHQEDLDSVQNQTDEITSNQDSNTDREIANEDKNTNLLLDGLKALGNFIIEGLKSLFIPSDGYFTEVFNRLNTFFADRFGMLYAPMDILIRFCNLIIGADSSFAGIPLPELSYEGHVLLEAQTVKFDILGNSAFADLQQKIYFVGNIGMVIALLLLMHRKFEEVLGN